MKILWILAHNTEMISFSSPSVPQLPPECAGVSGVEDNANACHSLDAGKNAQRLQGNKTREGSWRQARLEWKVLSHPVECALLV